MRETVARSNVDTLDACVSLKFIDLIHIPTHMLFVLCHSFEPYRLKLEHVIRIYTQMLHVGDVI